MSVTSRFKLRLLGAAGVVGGGLLLVAPAGAGAASEAGASVGGCSSPTERSVTFTAISEATFIRQVRLVLVDDAGRETTIGTFANPAGVIGPVGTVVRSLPSGTYQFDWYDHTAGTLFFGLPENGPHRYVGYPGHFVTVDASACATPAPMVPEAAAVVLLPLSSMAVGAVLVSRRQRRAAASAA